MFADRERVSGDQYFIDAETIQVIYFEIPPLPVTDIASSQIEGAYASLWSKKRSPKMMLCWRRKMDFALSAMASCPSNDSRTFLAVGSRGRVPAASLSLLPR